MPDADEKLQGWFAGRLPDGWFVGPPEVTYDREEILVVGKLAEPEVGEGAGDEARSEAQLARITGFREETRQTRMRIADEAELRFGRKVAWGARCGDQLDIDRVIRVVVGRAAGDAGDGRIRVVDLSREVGCGDRGAVERLTELGHDIGIVLSVSR